MSFSSSDAHSKQRLEGVVASAIDAIITIDERQRIVLFNPAAERMFGVPASDAMGQPISRFLPARFQAAHEDHIRRFRKTGVTNRQMGSLGAISGLRANGEEFPLEASISQVSFGDEWLATVILRDITERQAAEGALRESRQRMAGIVESAMDAIITVDEHQRIVLFNPAAERMFGVPASEAMGAHISRFLPERFRASHDDHIRRFREAGVTNRRMGALGAVSGLRANGEEFPLEASISQVEVGGERLATVILRDITERKQNEEARLLLAREVDHRAKNAMAVAQSLVKLTRADTTADYVEAVQGRIAALARAHSLLSKGSWQGADLGQVLADELAAYSKQGQVTAKGAPVTLMANAVQPVGLVIHELATNAFKYGALRNEQGTIRIEWRLDPEGQLLIDWTESRGPPVSAPSTQGFGSTLLQEVVKRQLDGALSCDWRPEGVKLTMTLGSAHFRLGRQGAQSAVSAEGWDTAGDARAARGRDVLVVEDESLIALELCAELARSGWQIVGPAHSLVEAMKMAESTPALSAAVLDVNLAGRAVYPLAERLKAKGVPFVFCTGYEIVDPEGRFQDTPVLRKPVNTRTLDRELDAVLRRAGKAPSEV